MENLIIEISQSQILLEGIFTWIKKKQQQQKLLNYFLVDVLCSY